MSQYSVGVFAMLALAATAANAEGKVGEEPQKDARWQELYRSEAAEYQFSMIGSQREKLDLQPQPVMQWVSLNGFNGDVFIWKRAERPEVVGSIFSFPAGTAEQRNVMHEFHSLSAEPVEAAGANGRLLGFAEGVDLKPIPGAPPPAESATRRRLQARALAREFSAHMNRQGERWELRLLNQPLYHYEASSDGILGGALFAFVGYITDPEILVLIEARNTPDGRQWVYAPARFSDKSLWLNHKEQEVWSYRADSPQSEVLYYLAPRKTVSLPADE